jgi:choline dehydrogenase
LRVRIEGFSTRCDAFHTPAAFAQLFKSDHDWDYSSEPEYALGGRRIYLPRGKVLGGCSSMNAMIYMRGNRADYDQWAAGGAAGWSYDELLPYFIKAENNERGASRFHGVDGPLFVQDGRSQHPLIDCIINAFVQAGHPHNDDFNGVSQLGAGRFQLTQHNGMRCSAATAYLGPARGRKNLDVITKATVTRVVLEKSRATGVEIYRGGEKSFVQAEREVILAAGAYNSPQLLMLSGVGKSGDLKAMGLNTLVELPVGDELQDHPGVLLSYFTDVSRSPHLVPASGSDVDVWSFIERHTHTFYHPTSTCGIGRVVDPLLRVLGVDCLRVVDASVMPTIVRANANAPVIAIAERAADLIRRSGPASELPPA